MKTNFIADEHTDFTEEKTRIQQMYQRITAPEDAVQRLIDLPKDAQLIDLPEEAGRSQKSRFRPAWKIAAACLAAAILIPSSVFAAEKISTYIRQATHGQQENIQDHVVSSGSHAELQLESTDVQPSDAQKKYVRVRTDFGADYVKEPDENLDENLDENTDDTYMLSYCHRDGFGAGKDFWYRLIQIDTDDTSALSLYDVKEPRTKTINGHKAVYLAENNIKGTRYQADYDTEYSLHMYLFFDEYGYIVELGGMQGLGQKGMTELAERISLKETSKKKAQPYILLSHYSKYRIGANCLPDPETDEDRKMTGQFFARGEKVSYKKRTYQITDVSLRTDIKGLDTDCFTDNADMKKLFTPSGKIRRYVRENLQTGDGIDEPFYTVKGEEKIQPILVYVTVKATNHGKKSDTVEMPSFYYVEEKNGVYYRKFPDYSRPKYMEDAEIALMPFYFEETLGGSSFYFTKLEPGETKILHYAYLIDEDLVGQTYLDFCDDGEGDPGKHKYVKVGE